MDPGNIQIVVIKTFHMKRIRFKRFLPNVSLCFRNQCYSFLNFLANISRNVA